MVLPFFVFTGVKRDKNYLKSVKGTEMFEIKELPSFQDWQTEKLVEIFLKQTKVKKGCIGRVVS